MLCFTTILCFVFVICYKFFNAKIKSIYKPKVKQIIKRADMFVSMLLFINFFIGALFSIAICMFESTLQDSFVGKSNILNDIIYSVYSDFKYTSFVDNTTFIPILRLFGIQTFDERSISLIIIVFIGFCVTALIVENTYPAN